MPRHACCACFTHNNLPCCNEGHVDHTGAQAVRKAWARSPLLRSVRANLDRRDADVERLTALADRLAARIVELETTGDSDCTATGFSGEGRCIESAVVGSLCEYHAEHVTGNAYADPDRAADDLAPPGHSQRDAEVERLVSLADRLAGKVARVEALMDANAVRLGQSAAYYTGIGNGPLRAALDGDARPPVPLGATRCRACNCEMDDHNDPRQGGACNNCGNCEGWL